ncbi:MAG: NAD(P)-dependent alcohol dehydrogenase [Brevundimonas sp.]|jgi:NADPH:quinone reductase-like Zn-dependent oxidoreductase|nr:MAG: NAD(P)-dependent alcohol dehydrogenase [Brevundimonas sp.]
MTNMMRRWEMDALGRDRLELKQAPIPSPGPGEVLVKVAAVALNYRDKMVIESGRGLPLTFPFTPGSDLAGTVVALGNDVTRLSIGDRVISTFTPDWIDGLRPGDARTPAYRTLGGFYPGVLSEYVAFPQDWFVHAPTTLDDGEASTLPVSGLTAWFGLVERAGLQAGDTVLIPSTGGVAIFGLQIARAHGARVIVCGSGENLDRAMALGADHVVDNQTGDWEEAVLGITGDRGADHILEVIGGSHLASSVRLAAVGGHICQIGALEGFDISAPAMPLMLKDVTIHGIGTGSRRALERLVRAVDQTSLKPVIDTRYRFEDLFSALDHLDRSAFGKIVIDLQARG